MSTVITDPPADVVVLGMGVMSGAVAAELSIAGYKVVGIEKGPYYDYAADFSLTKYDEWGILAMRKFDHPLPMSTFTMRHNSGQFAPPVRRYTTTKQIISMGHGVGGMAQHYAGAMGRYAPWSYQIQSATASRYGPNFLTSIEPRADVEDWPLTYQDFEPYYEQWEQAWGITGTNSGPLIPQAKNFPLPPHPDSPVGAAFRSAAESLGYSPYPCPTALASQPYVNQYGVQINSCVYDGWCGAVCNYVCETGAKANSGVRQVPAAIKSGNFTLNLNSYVFRLDTDASTGNVTAAEYYDAEGNVHVQPGTVFFNGLWGFNIIRLMLNSGIGNPYNPTTISGSLGRGVTEADVIAPPLALGTLNFGANAYSAGNAFGGAYTMQDLSDDNFDHTGLNFVGGFGAALGIGTYAGGGPPHLSSTGAAASPANIGSKYKATWKDFCLPQKVSVAVVNYTNQLPVTDFYSDLDPHYNDVYGDPLARVTLDFGINEYNTAVYIIPKFVPILQKMGASNAFAVPGAPFGTTHVNSFQAHTRGGARIGSNPSTSVFNQWYQAWTCQNLFAAGEVTNTTGDNLTAGTHAAGPGSYVAAEGIKKYLASPGPLV